MVAVLHPTIFATLVLGKLLVVGRVKAFYARTKLAKEAKERQAWDTLVKGRKLDTDS
jgi:hypothetical protein